MFQAHGRRLALARANELRNSMVAGVWGNSNYDEENARGDLLEKIDAFYDSAVENIYGEEVEIDREDPFFAAMKKPKIRFEGELQA